jgi:Pyruvate/2-oxoacid:ferredoxin oxidoreductase gamma subunit
MLRRWLASAAIAALVALLVTPAVTLAHERRTIDGGTYDVVVGWDSEPAFVNQRNAAGIRISKSGTNPAEPVSGAEQTLQLQIRQGAQSQQFPLRAVFGQPGYYVADIVPTRAGDYVWVLSGTLGADPINETFDSADGKFDAVAAASGIEFPTAAPDPDQVNAQLQTAEATSQRALTVAYIGAALGVVGCVLAVAALLMRSRRRTGVLSTRDAAVRRAPGAGL